jgi:hypothetical protein
MVSTAADMSRFMRAALRQSAMFQPQWRADPAIPGVGLGYFMSDLGGVPGFFHTGARGHFSLFYLVPEHRIGIFVVHAMRQGGPHQNLRTEFARAVIERVLATRERIVDARDPSWPPLDSFVGTYRPSLLATTNIEKAAQLVLDSPVQIGAGERLLTRLPDGTRLSLARVGATHFRVSEGPQRGLHIVFLRAANKRVSGFAMSGRTQDPVSFDRLSFVQYGRLHLVLMISISLLFAGVAISAPVSRIVHRRRTDFERLPAWAWRSAVITGWLGILAPLSAFLLALSRRGEATGDAIRIALTVGLSLILLAAIASLTLAPFAWLAWRHGWWSRTRRTFFSILAAGGPVLVILLWEYHLLGIWLS